MVSPSRGSPAANHEADDREQQGEARVTRVERPAGADEQTQLQIRRVSSAASFSAR